MTENDDCDTDMDRTFMEATGFPRGRGAWLAGASGNDVFSEGGRRGVGQSRSHNDHSGGRGLHLTTDNSPVGHATAEFPCTSTPNTERDALSHLTDMMGQLGTQIGESIVSRLLSAGLVNASNNCQSDSLDHHTRPKMRPEQSMSMLVPQVSVHVGSDHDMFRGDRSDKYCVKEWVDRTKACIRKQKCPISEQAEEIMSRLAGKAKDVVKISLRSDHTLDVKQNPELIYNILLQYFSETSSCLPLADFYATLPRVGENPVDYWIRINKAADLVNNGLHRQGKQLADMSDEVTRMFIKHCPDPGLTSVFKCKPIHEWRAKDIQSRIDDYQREYMGRAGAYVKSHTSAVLNKEHTEHNHLISFSQSAIQDASSFPLAQNTFKQPELSAEPSTVQCRSCSAPNLPVVQTMTQNTQQPESQVLSRMMEMLEQLMDRVQSRNVPTHRGNSRLQRRYARNTCRVCHDNKHSTVTHCITDKLCFECFSPGHAKRDCPKLSTVQDDMEGN